MIVNYDNDPRNSIIYTSSLILEYLRRNEGAVLFDEMCKYCLNQKMEYSIFILSIDWMYLVGIIKEINNRNELILCN